MFVLAAVVLIIAGVLVMGVLGIATPSRTPKAVESSLFRGAGPVIALAAGGVLVVVLGGAMVGVVGRPGGENESTATVTATAPTTSTVTTTPVTATVPTGVARAEIDRRDAYMGVDTTYAYGLPPPVVDTLAPRTVLRITAAGFEPNATGVVEQCMYALCANSFPVAFDATGRARFQYLVDDAFAIGAESPTKCRSTEPPCLVRLQSNGDSAFLTTVFRDVAPVPRRVSVEPSASRIVDGAPVRVVATGFTPGERVQAMLCVVPDTHGPRCGAPGPVSSFTIGADGSARTTLVIRAGDVGSDRASCGRGATCGIVVSHPTSAVPAPAVRIVFAEGPSTRYQALRWLTGLGIALVLLGFAFFLARTTDWRKPSEADTPDLDRATLTD